MTSQIMCTIRRVRVENTHTGRCEVRHEFVVANEVVDHYYSKDMALDFILGNEHRFFYVVDPEVKDVRVLED